jgi:DNA-binding GntR family transcriptional regulator
MPLAQSVESGHRTKQEFVYRTLREAIVRCELRPGERLIIDELAQRLQVSAIPVREALQLLQAESLVVTVPHVGATVAPISSASIVDVFTVLEGLEPWPVAPSFSGRAPEISISSPSWFSRWTT